MAFGKVESTVRNIRKIY